MIRLRLAYSVALVSLCFAAPPADATAPAAWLSWSRDSRIADRSSPPGDATPLYMRITSPPPGYQALASKMRWTPCDMVGPCYYVRSDSLSGSPDGYWKLVPDGLAFGGDSSYYFRLFPREDSGDLVFKFEFGGGACGTRPAAICLDWVKFVTATGDSVYADVLGGVTLFGGEGDCGLQVQQARPSVVAQGPATAVDLTGGGFSADLAVVMRGRSLTRQANSLELLGPGRLRAVFDTRGMEGGVQLVVSNGAGDTTTTTTQVSAQTNATARYDPSSVIVWTRPGQLLLPAGAVAASLASAVAVPALGATLVSLGVQEIESCSPASSVDPQLALELEDASQLDIFVLHLADTNVVAACEALAADTANVRGCHPNWIGDVLDVVPWDALMAKSWHLRNVGTFPEPGNTESGQDSRASRAWAISAGGTRVRVGVLDSGSQIEHPDLIGRYLDGPIPDDLGVTDPHDRLGHGVPVAGIVAALGNGGGKAVGVDWSAEVYSVKIGNDIGNITEACLMQGLDYARAGNCEVVNLSVGGFSGRPDVETFFYNAFHAGIFISTSSGNYDAYFPTWPAEYYPYSVSVGASLYNGKRWSDRDIGFKASWNYTDSIPSLGSSYGNHLRFLAPGGRFIATTAGASGYADPDPTLLYMPDHYSQPGVIDSRSPYWGFGGTSASAPVVAGAAALIRSVAGDSLGSEEIAHLLALTARSPKGSPPGYQPSSGWGIIDIESAVRAVRPGMRIERGVAIGGVVTDTVAGPIVDLMDYPGLPTHQRGCKSSAYNIRRKVSFAQPFFGRPLVLKRTHGSVGTLSIPVQIYGSSTPTNYGGNPLIPRWEPAIDTVAAYPDSCVLRTRVYALYKNGQKYWWPCPPEAARMAYTLVGIPPSALDVGNPEPAPVRLRLSVGPTPARGPLVIEVVGPTAPGMKLELLDVQGRRARSFVFAGEVGEAWRVSLGDGGGDRLEPGLYFARVSHGIEQAVRRVVLLR